MARINGSNQDDSRYRLRAAQEDLSEEVAALAALNPSALRQKWKTLFGAEPSPLLGRLFMVRAIAYRLQERRFGGLKPSVERLLDRACESRQRAEPQPVRKARASAGTVLIREWGGVSHRVTVLDRGVVYRGCRYKSLSEVARAITGARWSGPLFFGLKRRTEKVANG
jgi:hypothetical protein